MIGRRVDSTLPVRRTLDTLTPARRLAGTLYALPGLTLAVLFGGLSSLFIWPCLVLPRGLRDRTATFGMRWFAWMCLRVALLARITVVGRELLPEKPGYLVVCNHRSWVDVALLQLFTNSNGVSKKEVAYIPFFGLNGYLTGAVFFDRRSKMGRAKVVTDVLRLLGYGSNVHVFPEGTRTRTGHLSQKVHLRLLQSVSEAGLPLVPACVWRTERAVPAEGLYVMAGEAMGIEIQAPVPRAEGQTPEEHAEEVWRRVQEMARRHGADAPFSD